MSNKFSEAVLWALSQTYTTDMGVYPVSEDTPHELVDKVGEYLKSHGVVHSTFTYKDLVPLLPQ